LIGIFEKKTIFFKKLIISSGSEQYIKFILMKLEVHLRMKKILERLVNGL